MTLTAEQVETRRHHISSSNVVEKPQENVPFADYLKWPHVSQSSLKEGRTSMLQMKSAMKNEKVATDGMNLSSALHCAFLEPELLIEKVVLWDAGVRRGKMWDEFKAEHKGKIILTNGYYKNLKGMLQQMRIHPEIRKWYARPGEVEVSYAAEINGVMVKGRVDKLTDDPIIDLKASDVELDPANEYALFLRHLVRMGWHIQGAIYCRLFKRKRFILCVVPMKDPWDPVMFEITSELLEIGDHQALMLLAAWKLCCANNHWPGRSDELVRLDVPKWMQPQIEITTGGVPVKLST